MPSLPVSLTIFTPSCVFVSMPKRISAIVETRCVFAGASRAHLPLTVSVARVTSRQLSESSCKNQERRVAASLPRFAPSNQKQASDRGARMCKIRLQLRAGTHDRKELGGES